MLHHYDRNDVINALRQLGIQGGDVVFSHSNIGFFGYPREGRSIENVFYTLFEAFLEVLGTEGTFIVPTFTYSFAKNQLFDVDHSPSTCGCFTQLFLKQPGVYRSEDPSVSVAAIGKRGRLLTENIPENAYGKESFFDRFYQQHGIVCNLNLDGGSTFIHYVERCLGVIYRFDKTFSGVIRKSGEERKAKSTIWVRYVIPGADSRFYHFHQLASKLNLCQRAFVGRGYIDRISAHDTFELIRNTLPQRPWLLTEAEEQGISPLPALFTTQAQSLSPAGLLESKV